MSDDLLDYEAIGSELMKVSYVCSCGCGSGCERIVSNNVKYNIEDVPRSFRLVSPEVVRSVIVTSSDPMTPSCLNRIFNVGRVARVLLVFTT